MNETPEQCIRREIKEEMELDLPNLEELGLYTWENEDLHAFVSYVDFTHPEHLPLHEGQMLKFFSFEEIQKLPMGWNIKEIVSDFFNKKQ